MSESVSKIQNYWEKRAQTAQLNPNATTDDVYLRELEIRTFVEYIKKLDYKNISVLDLGCGDGLTTISIAKEFPDAHFLGIDFSLNMIENAKLRLKNTADPNLMKRIKFQVGDATKIEMQFAIETFEIVISSRCLINLTTSKQQYETISKIAKILKNNGVYISSENFEDGNAELNKLRNLIGLPEIPVRWHNRFFNLNEYLEQTNSIFKNVVIINFSSAYYYATRVIYSKYCQINSVEPDYLHDIHKLSIDLPSMGNYSPIKLVIHKKQ
jgi:ubiquinone/menaquinone biosynthesis C-methylase UbiE